MGGKEQGSAWPHCGYKTAGPPSGNSATVGSDLPTTTYDGTECSRTPPCIGGKSPATTTAHNPKLVGSTYHCIQRERSESEKASSPGCTVDTVVFPA